MFEVQLLNDKCESNIDKESHKSLKSGNKS